MRHRPSKLFVVEAVLAGVLAFLFVLTLITREWIEAILGVDPDHGDGSLEWLLVAALGLALLIVVGLARWEWRRTIAQPG